MVGSKLSSLLRDPEIEFLTLSEKSLVQAGQHYPTYDGGTLPDVHVYSNEGAGGNNNQGGNGDHYGYAYGSSGYDHLGNGGGGGGGGSSSGGGGSAGNTSLMLSPSALLSYSSLLIDKNIGFLNSIANQATTVSDLANLSAVKSGFQIVGKTLGGLGVILSGGDSLDDGFSWGDAAKVGLGVAIVASPYGWAYAIVDISTGIIFDETLTDKFGRLVDEKIQQ